MGDDRAPCYFEGETLIIRASSLGGPICQLVAAGQGNDILPPPPWLQKAFDAGHHWEGPVLEELRRRGWREHQLHGRGELLEQWSQQEFNYEIVPGIVIRFHPDDVLIPVGDEVPTSREPIGFPEGPVIVEAKALSAANYEIATRDGAECLPYAYDWQLSAMMLGLRLPAVWVTVDKSAKGRPVPDDKEELIPGMSDEIAVRASLHAQWVAHPPIPKATIVKRVLLIRKLIQSGELPTDPAHHGANPCRFLYLCPTAAEQKDTVRLLGERAEEVARWARFYEQQKEIERLAKERKDEARGQLIELLGEDSRVAADGYVVRRDEVVSSRVNRKAIERDNGGAVPEGWLAESTSTRLTVEGPGA